MAGGSPASATVRGFRLVSLGQRVPPHLGEVRVKRGGTRDNKVISIMSAQQDVVSTVAESVRKDKNAVAVVEEVIQGSTRKRFLAFGTEYKWAEVKGKRGVAALRKSLGRDDFEEIENVEILAMCEVPNTVERQIKNVRNNDPSSSEGESSTSSNSEFDDDVVTAAKPSDARTEINTNSPRPEDQVHTGAVDGLALGSEPAREDEGWD